MAPWSVVRSPVRLSLSCVLILTPSTTRLCEASTPCSATGSVRLLTRNQETINAATMAASNRIVTVETKRETMRPIKSGQIPHYKCNEIVITGATRLSAMNEHERTPFFSSRKWI